MGEGRRGRDRKRGEEKKYSSIKKKEKKEFQVIPVTSLIPSVTEH